MKVFEATVRVSGTQTKAQISANDIASAKRLLEAQYGKGNILALYPAK